MACNFEVMVVFPVPDGAETTKSRPSERLAGALEESVIKSSKRDKTVLYPKKGAFWRFRRFRVYNKKMKLSLLRCLVAMGDNDLSVSAAARELRIAQPSASKMLASLEDQTGELFVRRRRRFTALTPLGREVLAEARGILLKCANIEAMQRRHRNVGGDLRIGTTHLQARYVLPEVVRQYMSEFAGANIQIFQNTPSALAGMLEQNQADVAVCTESLEGNAHLESSDVYTWNRIAIMRRGHPLENAGQLTLKKLAAYPVITYVPGFTGRASFDEAFRRLKIPVNVSVAAADSDVIKTYVRAGSGVGVVAAISYIPEEDGDLARIPAAHLFPNMRTRIGYARGKFITEDMRRFTDILRRHAGKIKDRLGAKMPVRRGGRW